MKLSVSLQQQTDYNRIWTMIQGSIESTSIAIGTEFTAVKFLE